MVASGLLLPVFAIAATSTDSFDVNINVSVCDNDGACETDETNANCPADCPVCNNNGVCDGTENISNCPADCPVCDNDGTCDSGETTSNCSADCPVVIPPGGGIPPSDAVPPVIKNARIDSLTSYSAAIIWETNELAVCQTDWGETTDYRSGSAVEISFEMNHQTNLPRLNPATRYYFALNCFDREHNTAILGGQQFITLPLPDNTAPDNVRELEAVSGDRRVVLFWRNPAADFAGVAVRRALNFYPGLSEGAEVYRGFGESTDGRRQFVDAGLLNGRRYFYSLFSFDFSGNFSSGAAVSAVPQARPATTTEPEFPLATTTTTDLTWRDFDFSQNEQNLPVEKNRVEAKAEQSVEIRLPMEKMPAETTKAVVFVKKGEKQYIYALKIDADKKILGGSVAPFADMGDYEVKVDFFNKDDKVVKEVSGLLRIKSAEVGYKKTAKAGFDLWVVWLSGAWVGVKTYWWLWVWWILILLALLTKRHLNRKKDDQHQS